MPSRTNVILNIKQRFIELHCTTLSKYKTSKGNINISIHTAAFHKNFVILNQHV